MTYLVWRTGDKCKEFYIAQISWDEDREDETQSHSKQSNLRDLNNLITLTTH